MGWDARWDASCMQCITYFKALYHRLNYYEHTRAAILLNAKKQQQELSVSTTVIPLEWQQSCVKIVHSDVKHRYANVSRVNHNVFLDNTYV